jgi:hypothetical protein
MQQNMEWVNVGHDNCHIPFSPFTPCSKMKE